MILKVLNRISLVSNNYESVIKQKQTSAEGINSDALQLGHCIVVAEENDSAGPGEDFTAGASLGDTCVMGGSCFCLAMMRPTLWVVQKIG